MATLSPEVAVDFSTRTNELAHHEMTSVFCASANKLKGVEGGTDLIASPSKLSSKTRIELNRVTYA